MTSFIFHNKSDPAYTNNMFSICVYEKENNRSPESLFQDREVEKKNMETV